MVSGIGTRPILKSLFEGVDSILSLLAFPGKIFLFLSSASPDSDDLSYWFYFQPFLWYLIINLHYNICLFSIPVKYITAAHNHHWDLLNPQLRNSLIHSISSLITATQLLFSLYSRLHHSPTIGSLPLSNSFHHHHSPVISNIS
jgi:hypothetical protein